MLSKQYTFSCNRPVIKGNLHEEKCAYLVVSSNVIITDFPYSYPISRVLGKEDRDICYLVQNFA
jgi:hypothetical protein